ncbi:MAG: hypothetical protein OXH49_15575 [Gemmatimonadetes bacterium]|nr:hypothetical protein [Gemmatimonadota bacterium]
MRKLVLVLLAALPSQAQAQDTPGRMMLEAGIVGGNSIACPARYVGINGRVAGPVSVYGMVENYRCVNLAGTANRVGASILFGRSAWFVRPALRLGIEYDNGEVSETIGASLAFGRRYGARFIVHFGDFSRDPAIVLFQMGGYISFG